MKRILNCSITPGNPGNRRFPPALRSSPLPSSWVDSGIDSGIDSGLQ